MATDTLLDSLKEDGFGWWLSGFVDGEGHFAINKVRPSGRRHHCTYGIRFVLSQRADNAPVLHACADRTGLGVVKVRRRKAGLPQAEWLFWRKAECQRFCSLLQCFPLRSKKRRDFRLWHKAVRLWGQVAGVPGKDRRRYAPIWARVDKLKQRLTTIRRYSPQAPATANGRGSPEALRHWFSGFFDGEGTLSIRGFRGSSFGCAAYMNLRADDAGVIDLCRSLLPANVHYRKASASGSAPGLSWAVQSRADCQHLAWHFERYPLRGNKARDFAIWDDALTAWLAPRAHFHATGEAWDAMAASQAAMFKQHEYEPQLQLPSVS